MNKEQIIKQLDIIDQEYSMALNYPSSLKDQAIHSAINYIKNINQMDKQELEDLNNAM
jgi:hypothetical protein